MSGVSNGHSVDRRGGRWPAPTRVLAVLLALALLLLALGGCAGSPPGFERWAPHGGGDPSVFEGMSAAALDELSLVSTDLVSVLVQLPELSPAVVTLQLSPARSAFGNTLMRALEDAGYGVQRVSADQGRHYMAYRRGVAETDAGPVTDYELSVNGVRVRREYVHDEDGVYPSSLMGIEGSAVAAADVVLDESMFREQGGERTFVSGVSAGEAGGVSVSEVAVAAFERLAAPERTVAREVLGKARRHRALAVAELGDGHGDLDGLERVRRTVLIFEDGTTRRLGAANKRAVRLLARDTHAGDLIVVTACTDVDGRDETARSRGVRVIEEFLGHGLASEAVRLAPCARVSYRHASDDSPVPVEVVQYRPRGASRS